MFHRFHVRPDLADLALRQLTRKSTVVAIVSAVTLLVGWNVSPEKLDALGLVVSVVDTVVPAVVQERQGQITTTTVVPAPPEPPVVVTTTTNDK
jgi:hypothetical protein